LGKRSKRNCGIVMQYGVPQTHKIKPTRTFPGGNLGSLVEGGLKKSKREQV